MVREVIRGCVGAAKVDCRTNTCVTNICEFIYHIYHLSKTDHENHGNEINVNFV